LSVITTSTDILHHRDLYLLFREHGTILSVSIMTNADTGLSRGFDFVSFTAPEEAAAGIVAVDGLKVR
jgi:RNA recognition motif-containing protein